MMLVLVAAFVLLIAYLYRKIYDRFDYFEKRRIPTEKPLYPIVGNLWKFWKEVQIQREMRNMKRYGKVWGSFEGSRPVWNIADPGLIRDICIKEFDHFTDRRVLFEIKEKVLSKMLANLKGQEWKDVRSAVSPVFSSGKIKKMSQLMESCGETLVQHLREAMDKSQGVVNVKDQYGAYTMDVIATCAFGTKLDSLGKENDPFTKNARKFFADNPLVGSPLIIIPFVFPWLLNMGLKIFPMEPIYFFRDLVLDIMKQRKTEGRERGDVLDTMMEQEEKEREAGGEKVITEDVIAAQSLIFFVAGFDTTASMMNFLTYVLAVYPAIQDRLYEEIEKNMDEYGGINHEMMNSCVYLDQVVHETLRFYPPANRLERECTKDCIIDGIEFKKGDLIAIPVYAVHHCSDFYRDPEIFDPDRKIYDRFDYFEKQRIPTEKPLYPLLGNLWNFWKEVQFQREMKNMKRYGKVWGSFEGSRPVWNIADVDLIRDICIKEFDHFTDRRIFFPMKDKVLSKMLTMLKGQKWKDVRSAVSPVFSSGKIKKMSQLMESCGKTLVQHLREAMDKSQGVVCVKDQYGAYTLDVIATCAFGTKLDSLGKENDPFIKNARKFFADNPLFGSPLMIIPFMFPWVMQLGLNIFPMEPLYFFRDLAVDIMKQRKTEGHERGDVLDTMMEQEEKEREAGGEKVITEEVIVAQSLIFFVAGFDTTASMMNFVSYVLAIHPDIQDRLYQEIEKKMEEHGGINHEMVNACVYLDQVVNETFRFYTPASRLERECTKDCIIDGIEFKKGDLIGIPAYVVHHCSDYYRDPEIFDPERKISDQFDYFKKQRIPTEKPVYPIVGNLWNFWKEVQFLREMRNVKKYGKVWGSFEGSRPVWNIADPDLIRDIGIKEFDHFTDRRLFLPMKDKVLSKMLTMLKGQEWKDVRSAVSPVFSSGKIKKVCLPPCIISLSHCRPRTEKQTDY
ncbi:unnamed protein product [Darwinula stevensoni]|uniref:Cytochrome P450 n=1 Tax=Darwinula stevensoni TaxID=69355 RepID=A0A7R8X971_9CRUS|nr:unnamed protein product [Darwinula stevensoni]CAG0890359.1 unnamed protein product [Darwinula stevensoni]